MKRAAQTVLVILVALVFAGWAPGVALAGPIIADHLYADLTARSQAQYQLAKDTLHIAYGHTSHGSQVTTGMSAMVNFINGGGLGLTGYAQNFFSFNNGGSGGALDLHDYFQPGDLGNPDRTTWANRTRTYLNDPVNSDVNVIMWSWCGQADTSEANIVLYLDTMAQLELDYPDVTFVYMTGHVNGGAPDNNLALRNQQIRNFVFTGNRALFDFADIESWDPDGLYVGDKLVTDDCWYDSDGNGSRDKNWAIDWQKSHVEGVDWYAASSAHSQPLNANRKAYAAWTMFADIAEANAVPIPGAAWLLGSGLLGVVGLRRRR